MFFQGKNRVLTLKATPMPNCRREASCAPTSYLGPILAHDASLLTPCRKEPLQLLILKKYSLSGPCHNF